MQTQPMQQFNNQTFDSGRANRRQRRAWDKGKRRRGVVALYVAIGLVTFLGAAALAVDMSSLYSRKAKAQRAADAAALAGAYQLTEDPGDTDAAVAKAKAYAALPENGGFSDSQVTVTPSYGGDPSSLHVVVSRREPLFFARIFGLTSALVGAGSTGSYYSYADIDQNGADYGSSNASVYYSVYGPNALRTNGDRFSSKYLLGTSDPLISNPDYDPNGYNFIINVPADFKTRNKTKNLQVEIFDPDTSNPKNRDGNEQRIAGPTSDGRIAYDEIRSGYPGDGNVHTNTTYKLWYDGDPDNPVLIAERSFRDDTEVFNGQRITPNDSRWTTPKGMLFDPDQFGGPNVAKKFRLQVVTTEGSSENGFNLRAGPEQTGNRESIDAGDANLHPGASAAELRGYADKYGRLSLMTDATWKTTYGANGTTIAAQGKVPLNFNADTRTDISLGHVPKTEAKSPQMTVTRFDTDVAPEKGTLSVYYTTNAPGLEKVSFAAQDLNTKNNDNATQQDVIPLDDASLSQVVGRPVTYPAGGADWTAHYYAGNNDTSSWQVTYAGKGNPGRVRITR